MSIIKISSNNKALLFLEKRIESDQYRGLHHSQHNRYAMKQILTVLELLDKYVSLDEPLMTIRTTDISKRPFNTPEEADYASFCDEAKEQAGIGTQDAMRKNLFVDMHRMGLIERYNKKKHKIDPYKKSRVKYVALTDQGKKLVSDKYNELEKYLIYSKAIDKLLGGYIDILLNIFYEYQIEHITIYEYMFFISAINVNTDFMVSVQKSVQLIKKYRLLSRGQREALIDLLNRQMQPKNYTGNKLKKRDFHNWKNEAQQVFSLLKQTAYFDTINDKLITTTDKKFNEVTKKLKRSSTEKRLYFDNHKVGKKEGFELHHVVPLAWSESIEHFKLLDKWQNMLYIDAFSHAKITQNKSLNVIIQIIGNNITLEDYFEHKVVLVYKENILYAINQQNTILEYNSKLLEVSEIFGI